MGFASLHTLKLNLRSFATSRKWIGDGKKGLGAENLNCNVQIEMTCRISYQALLTLSGTRTDTPCSCFYWVVLRVASLCSVIP